MKTREELEQYIFSYKSRLLNESNVTQSKYFDRANSVADKLGSQLITLSSVLLTILGGLIASSNIVTNNDLRILLTLAILFLIISIGFGLYSKFENVKFFNKWAIHAHEEGRMINEDRSATFDDLALFRSKIINTRESLPESSPVLPDILQVTFFVLGILLIVTIVMVLLYT